MKSFVIYFFGTMFLLICGYINWIVFGTQEVSVFVGAGILLTICLDKFLEERWKNQK